MYKINPNVSIFFQLAEFIKMEIFSFKRKPGSKLESIRNMALILEVNPNTIKRVYQELENEGLIFTDGNLGTYVVNDEDFIKKKRDLYIKQKFQEFYDILKTCHVEKDLSKYLGGNKDEDY